MVPYSKSEFCKILSATNKDDFAKILEKSQMKYGYDKNTRIYSVKFYVKKAKGVKEERLLTMRVSPNFLEYSLADSKGKVLELLRQEGTAINFSDFKSK
ncbi:MAG: hypothetical protein PHU63_02185 [Candidatus ainarchaeum sp.]|nr:hypothetical protein [Candidatus ainarchaeum sp.]